MLALRRKGKEWAELWRTKVPSKFWCFYGYWPDTRSQQEMCDTIGTWLRMQVVHCAVLLIHGGTLFWSAIWLNVCGLLRMRILEFLGQLHCADARAWLAEVMSSLKQDEITRVVVCLWAIWFARRKAIHENQFQSPFLTHTFVERFIGELEEINQESPEVLPVAAPVPRWVRPPSGLAKINVDAAMSKNSGQATAASCSPRRCWQLFWGRLP